MGAIEDVRKLLQDFVAPELRALSARLDGVEQRFDGVDQRLDGLAKAITEGDERTLKAIEQAQREILLMLKLAQSEQRNAEYERQVKALWSNPAQQ